MEKKSLQVIGIFGEELIDILTTEENRMWIKDKLTDLKKRLVTRYGDILIITRNSIGVEMLVHSVFDNIAIINPIYYVSDFRFHITAPYTFIPDFCDLMIVFTHNPTGNSKLNYFLNNGNCLWVNYGTRKEKWLKKELE